MDAQQKKVNSVENNQDIDTTYDLMPTNASLFSRRECLALNKSSAKERHCHLLSNFTLFYDYPPMGSTSSSPTRRQSNQEKLRRTNFY